MADVSLDPTGAADAGAFLARLLRLDPTGVVRLRAVGEDRVALWAHLPFDVLVTRVVAGSVSVGDATVAVRALMTTLRRGGTTLPPRLDTRWRWGLPPPGGEVVEVLPAATVRGLAAAAERTVRSAAAGVGGPRERALRDALLGHVAVVVHPTVTTATAERIEVPQRLVQAVMRMGFLRPAASAEEPPVRVVVSGRYVGLAAEYGLAWYRPGSTFGVHPIG
jgi:hypothetical protein